MNRHQILTGACNGGDCYALGSVEGVNFVAYASGCDIVILASTFQRVVTIPGVLRGNIKVSCVDCSTDTGKIAASFGRKIYIFEPTPANTESSHKLDYRWVQTAEVEADCFVRCLSWNTEGSRLLTGGETIQIWEFVSSPLIPVSVSMSSPDTTGAVPLATSTTQPSARVQFHVGEDEDPFSSRMVNAIADPDHKLDPTHHHDLDAGKWECVWKNKPANPVTHLKYSPDSFVFASLGKGDRLVKIWYEDQKVSQSLMRADSVMSPKKNSVHYTFIYISHPRAVTGFQWRKTSKYMPRGSVANMLVTSCEDNVCRIFVETILPDTGLLDLENFDPTMNSDPKFHTQRHKKRFVQRLKTIRQVIHKRKKHKNTSTDNSKPTDKSMNKSSSVHDFHKFAIHHNGVSPVLHFHLACSINPDNDIPLHPIVGNKNDVEYNFRLHWLNNKDLHFTIEAEKLLQELHQRLIVAETSATSNAGSSPVQPLSDTETDLREDLEYDSDSQARKTNTENGVNHMESNMSKSSSGEIPPFDTHSEFPLNLLQQGLIEKLDRKIDVLLHDWHNCPDYVFSVHPVDGSFLVWVIDHLDESSPFTFHQAQASFSSRLPRAFPIADARSMASNLLMYCNYSHTDIKSLMKMSGEMDSLPMKSSHRPNRPSSGSLTPSDVSKLIPSVNLVTKHMNGSLNLWQVTFAENNKFQNITSVTHTSRCCGHRFRTNSASCHPVLPLMLTTSHHNVPVTDTSDGDANGFPSGSSQSGETPDVEQVGPTFCSELILWQVSPVGPLSKSGGISELCRINNSNPSAFTSVAWVPALLPSTSLGSYSNSPSTLFVASDGNCLRLFQSVIDARSLLMERSSYAESRSSVSNLSSSSASSSHHEIPRHRQTSTDLFNVVSLQSSTRPGCILELDAISDATQDWQHIQLLHVFQEQLITGEATLGMEDEVVDLSSQQTFEEVFFLLVLEKSQEHGSVLHMWKLNINSKPSRDRTPSGSEYQWNDYSTMVDSYNDDLSPSGVEAPRTNIFRGYAQTMTMCVSTTKVCTQRLSLPENVEIITASVAAGHLSSASIYPACYAPYLFVTACSDGEVRFWNCTVTDLDSDSTETSTYSVSSYEFSLDDRNDLVQPCINSTKVEKKKESVYTWGDWERPSSARDRASGIVIQGQPIAVSCAYSGRIAVAYRTGPVRTQPDHPEDKIVNLRVMVQECESTGGSEWVQEDIIELNNIKIPDPKNEINMDFVNKQDPPLVPECVDANHSAGVQTAAAFMTRTKSVPSLSTILSVKKNINESGNKKGLLRQKCLVQLDWVSAEDGSHLLTVGIGSKILIYGQVSNEIARSLKNMDRQAVETKEEKRSAFANSKRLAMNKSIVVEDYREEIKWMRLKGIELTTADGLPPLPMHMNWVRGGILVVGMDNEMQVFTQWRTNEESNAEVVEDSSAVDKRTLTEANLVSAASSLNLCNNFKSKSNFKTSLSASNFKTSGGSTGSSKDSWKKSHQTSAASRTSSSIAPSDSLSNLPLLSESGLFEAARFANPVLPQYHPKLLMELMNFGKLRRVKAILAHLVRCISSSCRKDSLVDEGESAHLNVNFPRQRSVSVRSEENPGDEDLEKTEYVKIMSIPPLPLYALITADKDVTPFHTEITNKTASSPAVKEKNYDDLLSANYLEDLDYQLNNLSDDGSDSGRKRLHSNSGKYPQDPYAFNQNQATVLTEYLFKLGLPGLSGNDQFYLAALAEVVGSNTLELGEQLGDNNINNHDQGPKTQETMDESGLRFLLAMRQFQCLIKTMPHVQRAPILKEGMKNSYLVWAFHSEATKELLAAIPCMKTDTPTWDELRLYGVGWWMTNVTDLKMLFLKIASTAFKKSKEPMDAALYYVVMKKVSLIKNLFKTVYNSQMEKFFGNDFTSEKGRRIAIKNAYKVLSLGRYQHAAALFILGGQLQTGTNIILEKMDDIQLAIVCCRVYEDSVLMPQSVKTLFYKQILGLDENGENYDPRKASSDPFLRSMALWQLKDLESSLQTLLEKNVGVSLPPELDRLTLIPPIFNFYNFLRMHPLITRHRLASSSLQCRTQAVSGFTHTDTLVSESMTTLDRVTPTERQLFFAAAHAHFQNGCPLVAIEVMRKLPSQPLLVQEDLDEQKYFANRRRKSMSEINNSTGTLKDVNVMSMDIHSPDGAPPLLNSFTSSSNKSLSKGEDRASNLFSTGTDKASNLFNSGNDKASNLFGSGNDTASNLFGSSNDTASNLFGSANDRASNLFSNGIAKNELNDSGKAADLFSNTSQSSNLFSNPTNPFASSNPFASTNPFATADSLGATSTAPSRVRFQDELDKELAAAMTISSDEEEEEEGLVFAQSDVNTNYPSDDSQLPTPHTDVMAQQYKFIACLKVLMEELGNLATGFEVDGGHLRHQLYIWLEKEVEVLKVLCNYGNTDTASQPTQSASNVENHLESSTEEDELRHRTASVRSDVSVGRASLHEYKAEKQDLHSKVERLARRKAWLKSNQHLLRTLTSYTILQGSGGGGLASVRMELLLLLQELQQERHQQQLMSPLPFPTTLPLLSASITNCRSVIADPVQYLQGSIQDLLLAILEMPLPPSTGTDLGLVTTIQELAVALSSCIYQSLCDSDSFSVPDNSDAGIDGFISPDFSYTTSHLMAGVKRHRHKSAAQRETINTPPAKWPGVASLKVLLAREKDEDSPKMNILLTEALMAVYTSLLVSALSLYDPHMLYRLISNKLDPPAWAALFGGGVKTAVKIDKTPISALRTFGVGPQDERSRQRMLFNFKVMPPGSNPTEKGKVPAEVKETYKEKFVPPEISMVNNFMTKPFVASADELIDYDSEDSVSSESSGFTDNGSLDDNASSRPKTLEDTPNTEHTDSHSYSWCIIRLAVVKSVINNLNTFLPQIGIETSELANVSPLLHMMMKNLSQWMEVLQSRLDMFSSAPVNYIPGVVLDGQPKAKLQILRSSEHTPFLSSKSTLPIKRLWLYLVKQDSMRDLFIRYCFKRSYAENSEDDSVKTSSTDYEKPVRDPMKIIHKEQDIITAFAINNANNKQLVLSTQKEVVELDIGYLLQPPKWLENDNELDIEILNNPTPGPANPEFLVVQTPQDTVQPSSGSGTPGTPYTASPSPSMANLQTGRGSSVILRRPVIGVRRIGSHPVLPHYLTGGTDGAVRLWEWGHNQPITTLRQPGNFPKVTKVLFNAQGNKCCVSDTEGGICLWQVGLGSSYNKPIMSLQCHNKTTSDFQFVGSSSLIATAGQSAEMKNVCLWDTLLPKRSSLVHAFQCHDQGSPALVYAARQHMLISGGRKGEICIFDLRQRVLKHTFQAHDAPIKSLALDADEDYFVTGSAEGDIKVWAMQHHQCMFSFPGEHSKTTFFKNVGSTAGVAQLSLGPLHHLYSCGVDGSMKFRQLPERELVTHQFIT